MKRLALLAFAVIVPVSAYAASKPGYYRLPAIHGDTIVFTAEGDLWSVGVEGGTARRLTSHPGIESGAAISPDGATVAFTGEYEGPTEIYTMPVEGGLPVRRSYWGRPCRVVGWTPDGRIIAATQHFSTLPSTQAILIDTSTGIQEPIPLAQASDGDFDPSGATFYFTRFSFQGSHTKRYHGGTAQNIWKFTADAPEAEPLTADYKGTSRNAMWWQGRVYFVSDRDGTMNIWSMDPDGGDLTQHTFHSGWDVKDPDLDQGRIVYQVGADLYLLDIDSGDTHIVPITLASDFDQTRDNWVHKPFDYLTSSSVSPDGDRVALISRGRLFVAPSGQGRLVEADPESGVRYYTTGFMPDGQNLLAISDKSGELEFWKIPARGIGRPEQLTRNGTVYRVTGSVSPDGKWIASTDRDLNLWLFDVRTGRSTLILHSEQDIPYDLTWSPDSKWLAFVDEAGNLYDRIMLYSLDDRTLTPATGDRVDSRSPAWSPDGKWLYFLSDRYFASIVRSPWGPRQPEPYFDNTTKIYQVALEPGLRSAFRPDDELYKPPAEEAKGPHGKDGTSEKAAAETTVTVKIDTTGIRDRAIAVPVEPGNYNDLTMTGSHLFWRQTKAGTEPKQSLVSLEIKNKDIEPKTLVEDIQGYEMSLDRKKIMVTKEDAIYVLDASGQAPAKLEDSKVHLSGWSFAVEPREEWREMLTDAWRLQRDFFYDPGLHGVDWKAMLDKYLPLTSRVSDREELNDLIGQMISELSALHSFVWGGDIRKGQDEISPGSLGALLERRPASGGYRIVHIYRNDPDYPAGLGPLAKPGVDAKEGDVITTINGVPVLSVDDPAVLLRNQVDKQVLLGVKDMPSGKSKEVIVVPVSQGTAEELRYSDWEYSRRMRVEQLGEGEIGYVHLQAMGGRNFSEWVRNFYPIFDRKGLIVDVRHNTGGNIDSWVLEKLLRRAWFYWKPRVGEPYWNMQYAFRGHMVVLCDEWTMSDGEAFTEGFRRLGLGEVMGTRTWGGEIWLSSSNFLLADRGVATSAQSGVYGPEGEWLIEGKGVEPDITVDNLPHATFLGEDAQLDAAIRYLKETIEAEPVEVPPAPPYPDKSFEYR